MKRIVIMIVLLAGLLLQSQTINAADGSQSIEVSYAVDEDARYPLILKTGKGGAVLDGDQKIRDSVMSYELKIGTQKEFHILPDKGWKIADIIYERADINKRESLLHRYQEDKKLTIKAETTKMELYVIFEKIDSSQTQAGIPPDTSESTVVTGMNMHVPSLCIMVIASSVCILLFIRKKRVSKVL